MGKNWFERNPKKTVVFLLAVFLVGAAYGAEKLLAYRSQGIGFNYALPERAIRLREYRPTMVEYVEAGKKETHCDSLVKKKYLMRVDRNGFIMPSEKYADPDICLAFLGASTTECRYVDEEHRFPYLCGALLEKDLNIKINSCNAARSGNHTLHSLNIFFNKVLPVHPKVVVMMHNINDLVILLYEKTYWNQNSNRSVIFDMNDEMVSNSFKVLRDRYVPNLSRALRDFSYNVRSLFRSNKETDPPAGNPDEFARLRGKKLSFDRAHLVKQFEMNLQTFIYACQVRGITPVLMTMASRMKEKPDPVIAGGFQDMEPMIGYREFKELFDSFNETIRGLARQNGILLIDLARQIPPEKEYMYDVVHYTDQGSVRVAEILQEQLRPVIKGTLHLN